MSIGSVELTPRGESACACNIIYCCLVKIEENLGISVDSVTTPTLPPYMPPLMLMVPWVVKVTEVYLTVRY